MQTHATVSIVDPKSEDEKVEEILGQSPEELAKSLADDEEVIAARDAAEASAEATQTSTDSAKAPSAAAAPDGFEWGETL